MISQSDFVDYSPHTPWSHKLLAAVLRRSIVDWVLYREHSSLKLRRLGKDAEAWLFRDSFLDSPINSFTSVCVALDLDPDVIRDKVRCLTEDEVRRLRGMEFGDEC